MLRRSLLISRAVGGSAPSLISILASRASSPATGTDSSIAPSRALPVPASSTSTTSSSPLARAAVAPSATTSLSQADTISILSQLRVLRSKWNLLEMERRRECERLELAVAECKSMRQQQHRSGGSGDDDAIVDTSKTLYNIERKLSRQSIASAKQRFVLARAVRLLRHHKLKAALQALNNTTTTMNHQTGSTTTTTTTATMFLNFLSDVAFFSACLRRIRREVETKMILKMKQQPRTTRRENWQHERVNEERQLLVELSRCVGIMPRSTRALISIGLRRRAAPENHERLSPQAIIAMLFSGTKSEVFSRFSDCSPLLEALLRLEKEGSQGEAGGEKGNLRLAGRISPADTVKLSLWFTTVAVSALANQQQLDPEIQHVLREGYGLLCRLWTAHAPHFGGVGSREPWLLLSCVPELDAAIGRLTSVGKEKGSSRMSNIIKHAAIKALLVEGLRGATAPAGAEKHAQPWSNKNSMRGERVALLEQQLATTMEPRRLFSLLALLGEKSLRGREIASVASVARAAVFGGLARSLPRITLAQAGALLMLVAGPSLDHVQTSAEAAAASKLIDSIFMRSLQLLERHAHSPTGSKAIQANASSSPHQELALMVLRLCTALAHLASRRFLQGGALVDPTVDDNAPTPRSRVLFETSTTKRAVSAGNKASSSSGRVRVSKQEAVNLCVAALVASDRGRVEPLVHFLGHEQKMALKRALVEMGELSSAREASLDMMRDGQQPASVVTSGVAVDARGGLEERLQKLKHNMLRQ